MNNIPTCIVRGTTARFAATFYDLNMVVTQPFGAGVNIAYFSGGQTIDLLIQMTPPSSPDVEWTASWDTRNIDPGFVSWSIHSLTDDDNPPLVVADGSFELTANNANLPTF